MGCYYRNLYNSILDILDILDIFNFCLEIKDIKIRQIQPLLTYWDLKLKHRHIYGKFDQLNLHRLKL